MDITNHTYTIASALCNKTDFHVPGRTEDRIGTRDAAAVSLQCQFIPPDHYFFSSC